MAVKEWKDDIVFLHEVIAGAANRSYGIHVAKLAGLPGAVITRAEDVLKRLEAGEQGKAATTLIDDLPLFSAVTATPPPARPTGPSAVEQAVAELDPDAMTPRQALEALYALRRLSLIHI